MLRTPEFLGFEPKQRFPATAKPFTLYHQGRDIRIPVKSFIDLLNTRINNLIRGGQLDPSLAQDLFDQSVQLYDDVHREDVPVYQNCIKNLERLSKEIGPGKFLMYGRDTEYLALAVLAHEYGRLPKIDRPALLNISTDVASSLDRGNNLDLLRELFEQKGVTEDFIHVDVGKYGNAARRVIRSLWPHLSGQEVDAKIRLIDSQHTYRKMMQGARDISSPIESIGDVWPWQGKFATIEGRPHLTKQGQRLSVTEEGVVFIVSPPVSADQRLLAWSVRQAIARAFLPRVSREGLKVIGRAIYKHKINIAAALGINFLMAVPIDAIAPDGFGIGVINPDSSGWYLTTSNPSDSRKKWGVGLEWLDLSPADYTRPLFVRDGRPLEPSTLSHRVVLGITADGFKYENTIDRIPVYLTPSAAPEIVHSP